MPLALSALLGVELALLGDALDLLGVRPPRARAARTWRGGARRAPPGRRGPRRTRGLPGVECRATPPHPTGGSADVGRSRCAQPGRRAQLGICVIFTLIVDLIKCELVN